MQQELLKELIQVQQELNAPKGRFNYHGKYNYRSLEDILMGLKPILAAMGCGVFFNDEIVEHGGRTFLRTTLTFFNKDGQEMSVTAEAEHAAQRPGMDVAQISGAASSYARKYACNAMFMIDDTQDADSNEQRTEIEARIAAEKKVAAKPAAKKPAVKPAEKKEKPASSIPPPPATADTIVYYDSLPLGMTSVEYKSIIAQLKGARNRQELDAIYKSNIILKGYRPFMEALKEMCQIYPKSA